MTLKPLSYFENLVVSDLKAAALPALAGWEIEILGDQVDWEKDQLNSTVSHLLVSANRVKHINGFPARDPLTLSLVAVVPGGLQKERRMLAMDTLCAVADWMRTDEIAHSQYQPDESVLQRIHPLAIASLTVNRVG